VPGLVRPTLCDHGGPLADHHAVWPVSASPRQVTRRPKRLLECLADEVRLRHYSPRTERAYIRWVRRFVRFHGNRHPAELGSDEVQRFLTDLAVNGQVSASTQSQALAAVLFFYDAVLRQPLENVESITRAKRSLHIPVVLTPGEVQRLLERMTGPSALMAALLYGSGLRLLECVELRVKDAALAAQIDKHVAERAL
jgi:site-specific recombinase XerD